MGKKVKEPSSSSEDSSSEAPAPVKKVTTPAKGATPNKKTPVKAPVSDSSDSSDSSDESSSSSEAPKKATKGTKKAPAKVEAKKPEKKAAKKKEASSSSDSDDESSSEEVKKAPAKPAAKASKKKSESSSSEESSSEEEKPKVNEKKRKADGPPEGEGDAKKAKTDGGDGNTRVFVGNLSFDIDDDKIREEFKSCGEIVDIHWITDRQTGKFYGNGFLQFATAEGARAAVAMNGKKILGRDVKVDFAQAKKEGTPNKFGGAQKSNDRVQRSPTPKPDGCNTVFLGNLSFQIDEDAVRKHFGDCGDITAIRWVERDGQFKGCGFVEFSDTNATDKAVALNGTDLMGRPVRVDFSAPKPPRQ